MNLFVIVCVFGAVLVQNSAAEDPAVEVSGTELYTDDVHYIFTPETTTPQPLVEEEDPSTEMPLAEDGDQRRRVVGPPDARDPVLHPGSKGSYRTGRGRNLKAPAGAKDGSGDRYSIPRVVEMVKGQVSGRRPTSADLALDERFRVPEIDDVIDAAFGKYDPNAPEGSWLDPLSVGPPPDQRRKQSSSKPVDEKLELLPEIGSGIGLLEVLDTKLLEVQVDDVPPPLNFKDYALESIADHQREQRAEDLLPPPHAQMILSTDPTSPHDAIHMRQVGYLCGVFESPLFHGELRAINESAFLLRNVYINSGIHYDQLKVVFKGPDLVIPITFNLKSSDKLNVHNKLFMLDTKRILADLREVTLEDDLKQFSVSMNISQCRRPASLWGSKLEETKNGLSSGAVVMHTADLLVIKSFTYPGNFCSAAYFWAGSGRNPDDGFKVPTIDGSSGSLRVYKNEDVLLLLPDFTTFYDLDYIGVYCPEFREMQGHHLFKPTIWTQAILPPAFTSEDRIRHPRIPF